MENYSYSSYPDSHDSSPRSREIDENASWDEPPSNYKVKFMCSYGGKILPRPHDNQLTYVGGDTKILAVDRSIRFSGIIAKLSSLSDSEVCFKYQLPGEDLDALISVTNDEDLEHMMIEYDRLHRGSAKPARLRLFLFPVSTSAQTSFSEDDSKSNQQWFVDALNSVPNQALDASSPPATAAASNPDFLFGLDKGVGVVPPPPPPIPQVVKLQDPAIESSVPEPQVKIPSGSDSGRDDRQIVGEQVVSPAEIQRQIHELQRLQIANQEQAMFHRKNEEALGRGFPGDYYVQKMPEKAPPTAVPVPQTMSVPTAYWQDRHMTTGGYHVAATGTEQQMYMIPPPTGMYQTPTNVNVRPVTGQVGQVGQGYYQMQRMVPDVYRDQSVYSMGPPPPQQQQQQQPPPPIPQPQQHQPQPTKVMGGMQMTETGYAQMAYDSTGRQVYYTAAPPGGVVPSSYPTVTVQGGVDARQSGPLKNQESKVGKPTL